MSGYSGVTNVTGSARYSMINRTYQHISEYMGTNRARIYVDKSDMSGETDESTHDRLKGYQNRKIGRFPVNRTLRTKQRKSEMSG